MPVYLLHGFRWHRLGKHGIRVYIIVRSLDDASAEYIQNPRTSRSLIGSLELGNPDIMSRIPELHFIEPYDPEDVTSDVASCQPFAFVASKVVTLADNVHNLSLDVDEVMKEGKGVSASGMKAMEELREKLAPEEKIGWHIVYNGDPERRYPGMSDEEDEDDSGFLDSEQDTEMTVDSKEESDSPEPPVKSPQSAKPERLRDRLFSKKSFSALRESRR